MTIKQNECTPQGTHTHTHTHTTHTHKRARTHTHNYLIWINGLDRVTLFYFQVGEQKRL